MADGNPTPSKVFTHGYVHGHIHKHRNHTHIHGHIHNHDHKHSLNPTLDPHQHEGPSSQKPTPNTTLASNSTLPIAPSSSAVVTSEASSAGLFSDIASTCLAFDSLPECSEMYCYELDDCFFDHCGDNDQFAIEAPPPASSISLFVGGLVKQSSSSPPSQTPLPLSLSTGATFSGSVLDESSTPLEHECCHDCQGLSLDPCDDPTCPIDTQVDCTTASTIHRDSLCQDQENKKQLFESLIKNLDFETSLELKNTTHDNISSGGIPPPKRRKMTFNAGNMNSNIDIHFPHICHQHSATNLHQSCFHTTIPNVSQKTASYDSGTLPNLANNTDYDFVIEFNNFDKLGHGLQNNQQRLEAIPSEPSTLAPERKFSCQWDNCFRALSDDTFMDHILGHHIEQEYRSDQSNQAYNLASTSHSPTVPNSISNSFNRANTLTGEELSTSTSTEPSKLYQCEWNNCNFAGLELNGLINHILQHKESSDPLQYSSKGQVKLEKQEKPSTSWVDLTPSSTHLSPESTATTTAYQQLYHTSNPTAYGHLLLHHVVNGDQINITDFELYPKENKQYCTKKPIDPTYTCKWQIGVDPVTGNPIECNRPHDSAGSLQEHLISKHVGGGKSQYHCGWVGCERHQGKSFTQRQKLLRHIYIHTGYKPCVCPICGVSFAVEVLLTQHMRIHSGEKPYECQICGKRFATSSSLSIHNRVHSDNRPLVCPYPGCGKRFRESTNLTKHRRTHERLVTCEICHETFSKKAQLKKHMTDFHSEADTAISVGEQALETNV